MVAAPTSLLLVVSPGPDRLRNRMTGPFVKTLPQKLRTRPAEMHPLPFPAPLRHRRDPTVSLQFVCVTVTISLRTKGSQQPRCHHRTGSRQRVENEKVRMLDGYFLDLAVELGNALEQTADQLHDHFHHRTLGFDHRPIPTRRNRSADRQDAAFPQSSMAVVLAEEASQFFRRYFLQLFQRRPALQLSHIPAACPASQTTPPFAENKSSSSWLNDCFALPVPPSASVALPPGSALGGWLRHPATNGAAC